MVFVIAMLIVLAIVVAVAVVAYRAMTQQSRTASQSDVVAGGGAA
jgi:hypothetical protein